VTTFVASNFTKHATFQTCVVVVFYLFILKHVAFVGFAHPVPISFICRTFLPHKKCDIIHELFRWKSIRLTYNLLLQYPKQFQISTRELEERYLSSLRFLLWKSSSSIFGHSPSPFWDTVTPHYMRSFLSAILHGSDWELVIFLEPAVNFINVLHECFSYEILAPKITKLCFGFVIFGATISCEKRARKMLMKLTPIVYFSVILGLFIWENTFWVPISRI